MNVEALSDELHALLERVQAEVNREVERAQKAVNVLNAEKSSAQNALTQLRAQAQGQQDQLDAVTKQLNRASTLAALESEIAKARKELDALKAGITKSTTTVADLLKQQRAAEGQVATLRTEANNWAMARQQTEAAVRDIRVRLFG